MQVQFDYKPLPVFLPFHTAPQQEVAAAGGYGSGKTIALTADAIELGLTQPGSQILIMRKTVPSLRDTTEKEFMDHLPAAFEKACSIYKGGGHINTLVFPNGSTYYFRGLDDWRKLKSLNVCGLYYDEADEIDEETYDGMLSRLRQTRPTRKAAVQGAPRITRRKIRLAFNPAGRNWIWKRFYSDAKRPGTAAFKSTSLDNPYLPVSYVESLLAYPEPWVRRYVLCNFDEFAGQIYEEWGWDTHVIDPLRDAAGRYSYDPANWFLMGFDPGTQAGNAGVWCYYEREKHRLIAVAEYLESGLAVTKHVDAWRRIEAAHKMRVRTRIADPGAINVRDRGTNSKLSDQYRRLGYNFQLGPRAIPDRLYPLGQLIHQRRFVVTKECPRLFEQITNYRYEDLTPAQRERGTEANPLKKDVDLVDAAQYVASKYTAPPKLSLEEEETDERILLAKRVARHAREKLAGRSATGAHDLGSVPV